MSKTFTNQIVVIPRNEDTGDPDGSLRIMTDTEKETVSVVKHNWGNQAENITFPKQFLGDVIAALTSIEVFLSEK